jgi:twitching motility protein PilT
MATPVPASIRDRVVPKHVEMEVDKLFRIVMKHEGSDLHLKVGLPPMMRLAGTLRQMQLPVLTEEQMEQLTLPMLTVAQAETLAETGGVDFAHVIGDEEGRFRVNLFRQRGRLSLVARSVKTEIPDFEALHLPSIVEDLSKYSQGMVLLAGVTGSGKSTTIASMLQYINRTRRVHIVTIEDPIEYLFRDEKSIINQREVGIDVADWEMAMKHVVREDPDVILVGEMRDRATFQTAMQAAETGHLVFGTIHASTAPSTIARILDLFTTDMHGALRSSMAFNMRAIIAQKLLPSIREGVQRVPACEIMTFNPTVRKLILDEEDDKLSDAIRIARQEQMQDFTESLRYLVAEEFVDRATAFEVAPNVEALKMALKGISVSQPGIL